MTGPRTSLTVSRGVETISGVRSTWRFRPHYHAGDEIVQLLAGRALLRTATGCREISTGETVVVPAGVVHRFEPVDAAGWAFRSDFILRPASESSWSTADARLAARAIELLKSRQGLRSDAQALARACGVSTGYLARAFRRAIGTGLHNFHVLLVLQRAKALLRGGAALAATAYESGFYDQAHLTREFVRTYGFTPKAFQSAWSIQH